MSLKSGIFSSLFEQAPKVATPCKHSANRVKAHDFASLSTQYRPVLGASQVMRDSLRSKLIFVVLVPLKDLSRVESAVGRPKRSGGL